MVGSSRKDCECITSGNPFWDYQMCLRKEYTPPWERISSFRVDIFSKGTPSWRASLLSLMCSKANSRIHAPYSLYKSPQILLGYKVKKVPPDICAQRRLKSACKSTQSGQSIRCPHKEILHPWLSEMHPVNILIIRECTVWSECSLGAHNRKYISGSFIIRQWNQPSKHSL